MRILIAGLMAAVVLGTPPVAHADPTWQGRTHPHTPNFTVHSGIVHSKGHHHG